MSAPTGHQADPKPRDGAGRLVAFLAAEADRLGFAGLGVAPARLQDIAGARLGQAIADGHMGTMDWMADTLERRIDPTALWPAARSAVVLATNYAPGDDPRRALADRTRGVVSVYAARRDYHDVIKGRLKELAGRFVARARALGLGAPEVKVFVDTAPLLEKPLAERAGLGWQGKHTNLVSRAAGSWTFLGTILTDLDLPARAPGTDRCGSCRACLDACPTDAFPAPYRLDARRCVSYLTIEHAGAIPRDLRAGIGNRIFGCDDCLAACPWNKFAAAARDVRLALRDDLRTPDLGELAGLDDAAFRERFAGTPVKRVGRDRFLRNVLIAIGNSGAPDLLPAAVARLDDASALVRAAAVWALARLDPVGFAREAKVRAARETDPEVRAEWIAGPGEGFDRDGWFPSVS